MRIFPEMWASTLWPFSSSTRNMAFGQGFDDRPLEDDRVFLGFRQGWLLLTVIKDRGSRWPQSRGATGAGRPQARRPGQCLVPPDRLAAYSRLTARHSQDSHRGLPARPPELATAPAVPAPRGGCRSPRLRSGTSLGVCPPSSVVRPASSGRSRPRPRRRHALTQRPARHLPRASADGLVRTSGPSSVTAIVCSTWARQRAVGGHDASSRRRARRPRAARRSPSARPPARAGRAASGPARVGRSSGTSGDSCMARPMPWPQ